MDGTQGNVRQIRAETQEALARASVGANAGELPEMRPLPSGDRPRPSDRPSPSVQTPEPRNGLALKYPDPGPPRLPYALRVSSTRLPGRKEGQGRRCVSPSVQAGPLYEGPATNPSCFLRATMGKREPGGSFCCRDRSPVPVGHRLAGLAETENQPDRHSAEAGQSSKSESNTNRIPVAQAPR
jgi:hypothetical protein